MTSGIFILLGSNMGDKQQNLKQAKTHISNSVGKVVAVSSLYQTAAWGKVDQPVFYNQVVQISTELTAPELLDSLLRIEIRMGRQRIEKWGERLIDLDILYFNDEVIEKENLRVPHPGIPERRFTLIPLVELAADFVHPLLRKTNNDLLQELNDNLEVIKI
ncbi:MAG: 2-amino-4-hydroxy-6-hydroxymethyldihydropteridine diphosphokinase [Bacteroidota bacterium]